MDRFPVTFLPADQFAAPVPEYGHHYQLSWKAGGPTSVEMHEHNAYCVGAEHPWYFFTDGRPAKIGPIHVSWLTRLEPA